MEFRRLYVRVDLDQIKKNFEAVRHKVGPNVKIMSVIKADAYGHGAVEIGKFLNDLADYYAVANIDEAMELRNADITKPILILGHTDPEEFEMVLSNDVTIAIFSYEEAKKLNDIAKSKGKTAKVHIKVDTGMSRIGLQVNEDSAKEVALINSLENVKIEGIFTHMARADETIKDSSLKQRALFEQFIEMCEKLNVSFEIKHINNSAGIMEFDKYFDMVREGIILYGLTPSHEVNHNYPLYPAMQLIARISHIKLLEPGRGISYGHTYITDKPTLVATIPCGYADGYPRSLSNKGFVIIHGKRCPIIGRICMDQFMVDITDLENVKVGDEATLIGNNGNELLSMEEVSENAYSFNYELACTIGRRVPRVYFYENKYIKTVSYLNQK